MPKGKLKDNQSQLAKLPKKVSLFPPFVFPDEIQTLISDLSSIIDLAKAARTNKATYQFYLFKCTEAKNKGDDFAAEQMLYNLQQFAYYLNSSLIPNPKDPLFCTKFGLLFTKLTDAFLMARDNKLKSQIARLYFDNLLNSEHYVIRDGIQLDVFSKYLVSKISTIDQMAYLFDQPWERRLILLSELEALLKKAESKNNKILIAQHMRDTISLFKKETIEFNNDVTESDYHKKLDEYTPTLVELLKPTMLLA